MLTKDYILKQAAEVVFNQGYFKTRLSDVAQKIGVTRPNLYYHFKNKEDLMIQLLDWVEETHGSKLIEPLKTTEDPVVAVLQYLDVMTGNCEKRSRNRCGVVLSSLVSELGNQGLQFQRRVQRFFEAMIERIRERLEEGVADGYFKQEMDAAQVARWIQVHLQGYVMLMHSRMELSYKKDCRDFIQGYLEYMRNPVRPTTTTVANV